MKVFAILCLAVIGTVLVEQADGHQHFPESNAKQVDVIFYRDSGDKVPGKDFRVDNETDSGIAEGASSNETASGASSGAGFNETETVSGSSNETSYEGFNETAPEFYDEIASEGMNETASSPYNETAYEGYNETASGSYNETAYEDYNETASGSYNETAYEDYNETASGSYNETAYEDYNETASSPYNETAYEGYNETASGSYNETAYESSNETTSGSGNETSSRSLDERTFEQTDDEAAAILSGSSTSSPGTSTSQAAAGVSNETEPSESSAEGAPIASNETGVAESVIEVSIILSNETTNATVNGTNEEGSTLLIITGPGNETLEEEVFIYEANNTLVINATDEGFFDSEVFNVSLSHLPEQINVTIHESPDVIDSYRVENETGGSETQNANDVSIPGPKKVEVIFHPSFEGSIKYHHMRTEDNNLNEEGEITNSVSCKPFGECYSDKDCGEGGKCNGLLLGKCDCGKCTSLRPCKDDNDCGGLHGACDINKKMCNCHKGFASNGHGSDYFITVCNVMDCEPNTDSCFGLPCHKGSCSCK